jgi:hypothetical protein
MECAIPNFSAYFSLGRQSVPLRTVSRRSKAGRFAYNLVFRVVLTRRPALSNLWFIRISEFSFGYLPFAASVVYCSNLLAMKKLVVLLFVVAGLAFLAEPTARAGVHFAFGFPIPVPVFYGPDYYYGPGPYYYGSPYYGYGYYPGYYYGGYYGPYWRHRYYYGYYGHRGGFYRRWRR